MGAESLARKVSTHERDTRTGCRQKKPADAQSLASGFCKQKSRDFRPDFFDLDMLFSNRAVIWRNSPPC